MIDKPIEDYTLDTQLSEKIANNFTLYEIIRSDIAERLGIDNRITDIHVLHNAIRTTRRIAQPIRDEFGPFVPSSVYRCQELERALKRKKSDWFSDGQHTKGEAIDHEVPGLTNLHLAHWIKDHLDFDQLILECHNPKAGPNSGWVHASYKKGANRRQVLSYIPDPRTGKFAYFPGLITHAVA